MRKWWIIFIGFLLLVAAIMSQAENLLLNFYSLFPILIFPLFYFFSKQTLFFVWATLAVTASVFGVYLYRHPTFEMLLFGFEPMLILGGITFYRSQWKNELEQKEKEETGSKEELGSLKMKYESRLESLHHLEKQVSSLMDLFEIARDFSDCLSYEAIADLLHKKVRPELPFESLQLMVLTESMGLKRCFTVTGTGVRDEEPDKFDEFADTLKELVSAKELIKKEQLWIFPLFADGQLHAALLVDRAEPSDLAKFEVLAAHLVLQVKKIKLYDTVKELSIQDGLTGIFVRRHFLERFEDELKRCRKYNLPLALLMLDIDHFKRYNDDFGHLVGDATLKEVASLLRSNLRNVDILGRYGGEEFVIVIPETKRDGAVEVAERIRSSIARHRFKVYEVETRVTVSVGVALYPNDLIDDSSSLEQPDLPFETVQRADKALYRAKEEGRNRVILYSDL